VRQLKLKMKENTMKCKYCSQEAVYHRKISNELVCRAHFLQTIEKKIRKTVRKYQMFNPQEKVVVGVSGGKDSLVVLYNVLKLQERNPNSPVVEAILIDEGIEGYRQESIQIAIGMCKKWNVPLHIVSFKDGFGTSLDDVIEKLPSLEINACTVCGTVRRRLLNQKARELHADKLAIGHNLDDQAETFMQNIVRNDLKQLINHPPQGNELDPTGQFIPRIKPLMMIPEAEITRYCYYNNFPIQSTPCPYVEGFFILRREIQGFLNHLENQSAEIKYNLLKMHENLIGRVALKLETSQKISVGEKKSKNFCPACHSLMGDQRKMCYYCELQQKLS